MPKHAGGGGLTEGLYQVRGITQQVRGIKPLPAVGGPGLLGAGAGRMRAKKYPAQAGLGVWDGSGVNRPG